MKTFKVPTRLLEAAKRLKDNKTIYCGLDDEVKEVVKLAAEQGVLKVYLQDGCKALGRYAGDSLDIAYCLPDDIEIVSEKPEKTWWQKEGLILCEIETNECWDFITNFPDGSIRKEQHLGVLYRCKGYEFCGFAFKEKFDAQQHIEQTPHVYYYDHDHLFCSNWVPNSKPITATHTVWRKIETK